MYSVKGETHNPKIYVLPSELRSGDITGESRPAANVQTVYTCNSATIAQKTAPPRDRERKRQLDEAIRRALLKEASVGQVEQVRSVQPSLDEIDQIPDEPNERKGVLDEEFI